MSLQVRPCRPGKPSFALSDMIQSLIGTRSFFLAEVFPHIMHQMDYSWLKWPLMERVASVEPIISFVSKAGTETNLGLNQVTPHS